MEIEMRVHAKTDLSYRKFDQHRGVVNRISLKYWKKQAHREDRRNGKQSLKYELDFLS